MNRLLRWLDPLFGLALTGALAMAVLTALPGTALAAGGLFGGADMATESRTVADFEAVLTRGADVVIRQGSTLSVSVKAERTLLPLLETVVEDTAQGKTLVLRWKPNSLVMSRNTPVVTITTPRLSAVLVLGSGDVLAEQIKGPRLLARVEGSGDIKLSGLAVDELKLEIKGSGDILASGQATRLAVAIAGSGDVRSTDLKADDVSVSIAGSGDASVQADKTLVVSIAGSGDVVYSGNATVRKTVAGSGSVSRR